jgi:hypothetical protein
MVSQSDTSAPKPEKHFVDAAEGHAGCVMVVSAPSGELTENVSCIGKPAVQHCLDSRFQISDRPSGEDS